MSGAWRGVRLYTIGHSTRPLDQLVAILRSFDVVALADIRTVPRSRRNPQYETTSLARELPAAGIAYVHIPELGGLRKPRPDSPNAAWQNESFRGYADHMQTPAFEAGLDRLHGLPRPVAIMCAEAVPWRCHRNLVADALVARGAEVLHATAVGRAAPHKLTSFARVDAGRVTYPALV